MPASELQPMLAEPGHDRRLDPRVRSVVAAVGIGALVALSSVWWVAPPAQAVTDSKVTRAASAYDPDYQDSPFPDLAVTVSQTQDLIQQGVTVSWTGGKQSATPNNQTGGANYLQIMQCWGDEDGSGGTRPDRTTCQYGGFNLPGATRWTERGEKDVIPDQDLPYTAVGAGWWESTQTAIPFRSATGTTVATIVDGKKVKDAPDLDNNEFFTKYTTNEVSWAGSGADGSGSVSFEIQTAQESPGLGCGKAAAGATTGASCWLVVIPRGTADPGQLANTQSGLFWDVWKHSIAIKLGFKPAGSRCPIGADESQLSGSELISGAMGQWQPKLCNRSGGSVYSLITGPESDAALAANGTSSAPLAVTSRALSTSGVTDNLAYAPIGLTGVSIAFAIDHEARASGSGVSAETKAKNRLPFTTLNLTPRLLAKLLTASYTDALPQGADKSHLSGVQCITRDPDFLAVNDKEWADQFVVGVGVSDVLAPLGRSDAAEAIWTYILSDPSAVDFLSGVPDKWGMHVNPYYSTNPRVNPTGVGLALPTDTFPKADPVETKGSVNYKYTDTVNLVTWRPFTSSLDIGGYDVLRGDALKLGAWDQTATPPKFGKGDRDLVGLQAVLGLTDTGSAAKYQVYQAALLNPAGSYVAPTTASLSAAAAAMTKNAKQTQVVGFDPTSAEARKATAAYPLAMPLYAAANPAMSEADRRARYAAFITYAAGEGQTAGTGDGELPDGYAPIPKAWATQAAAAAAAIRHGGWPSASPSPSASSSPSAGSSATTTATSGSTPSTASSPIPPQASGSSAPALSGGATPPDPNLGIAANVVPIGAAAGVAAAIGVPLVSRRRRRQP